MNEFAIFFKKKGVKKYMATQFSINDGRKWKAPFYTMWAGQKLSLLGSQLVSFGLIWYLTEEFQSAVVLSMASLAGLVPQVLFAPFIGPFIDRWNRKRTMIMADLAVAFFTLVLSFMFMFDIVQIWHIYLLMFLRSTFGGIHYLASSASTPLMVPKERLTNINGLDQSFSGAMNLVSGPLGAMLLALINVQGLLWIDVCTALVAVGILAGIKVPNPDRKALAADQAPMKEYWKDLKIGLRYTWSWKGLMLLMMGALVLNFLINPAFTLLPLLTTEHYHKGAIELGLSQSLFGAGVLVMGIAMGAWGGFKKKMLNVTVGIFTMGLGLIMIGVSPEGMIGYSYVAAAIMGLGMVMTNAPINGSMQENVHPEMQGRVNSLVSSLATMGMPVGLMIAGPVSEVIGITTWFVISGVIFVLLSPLYFFNKDVNTLHLGHPKNADLLAEFGIGQNEPVADDVTMVD